MAHFDLSEVRDFADALGHVRENARLNGRDPVSKAGERLAAAWRRNARETALPHGKLYPRTIGHDGASWRGGSWIDIVGPDSAMPQGGMGRGFEYGSINQTSPHLDGNRAADGEVERFARACLDFGKNVLWAGIRT